MFMLSVKVTRKRMFLGALALVMAISAGVLWSRHSGGALETAKSATEVSEKSGKNTAAAKKETKKIDSKKLKAKTNDERVAFVESFGWEIVTEPAEILEVVIPKEFDAVYTEYNSIQKLQGCDLASLAGKRVKRYSYTITNYPEKPENIRINLLVYNNKIVGGDVCSLDENGFMHGFSL